MSEKSGPFYREKCSYCPKIILGNTRPIAIQAKKDHEKECPRRKNANSKSG